MKTIRVIAIGVLAGASLAAAQVVPDGAGQDRPYFANIALYQTVDLVKLQERILANLASENYGVVESSLAHAAHLRMARPDIDMSEIREAVILLASEGPTAAIRFKAHLVSQVCCEPDRFGTALDGTYESGDAFFATLGSRLQAIL